MPNVTFWKKIVLFFTGITFGLILCEMILHIVVLWFPTWSHPVARSWRVRDLKENRPLATGLDDWFYGARYVPGLDNYPQVFIDGVFHVSTSRRFSDAGFRDDLDEGEAPLLALGDSFTGCFGVESAHCWVNMLGSSMGVQFANLGMLAGGGLEQARRLERWGGAYRPKLIVWGFYGNDLWENWHFANYGPAWRGGRRGIKLWLYQSSILWRVFIHVRRTLAAASQQEASVVYKDRGWELVLNDNCRVADLSRSQIAQGLAIQRNAIASVKKWSESQNAILIIALFPTKEVSYAKILRRLKPSWSTSCDYHEQYIAIRGLAHEMGIPVIDLLREFKDAADHGLQLYFPKDDHWNEAGNYLAFTVIRDALRTQGLDQALRNGLSQTLVGE